MLKIGTRVDTCFGNATIVGYDLPLSDVCRYIVKLDSGRLFVNNDPAMFPNEVIELK